MTQLLVILTGAGISAESGLPTFRGAGGLWRGHNAAALATPEAFAADPARVAAFYDDRRRAAAAASPNPAHYAVARLQQSWNGDVVIATTNVDGLHERAGARNVLHLHGRLDVVRCPQCGAAREEPAGSLSAMTCTACGTTGIHRPGVVFFGEMPQFLDEAFAAARRSGIFVAVGCGGAVAPASMLPRQAAMSGTCLTIEINPEPTGDPAFHQIIRGTAAMEMPRLAEQLLSGDARSS